MVVIKGGKHGTGNLATKKFGASLHDELEYINYLGFNRDTQYIPLCFTNRNVCVAVHSVTTCTLP